MKKLIAVAVLGALAAPAFADSGNVTISGYMRGGLQFLNKQATGKNVRETRVDGRGQIQFNMSEDLGNGLTAVGQIRSRFAVDGSGKDEGGTDRTGQFGNHNTWVGLKGSFGQVRLGNGEDNFGDGKHDNLELYGDELHGRFSDSFTSNMIRYDMPAMGGFTGSLQWSTKEDKTTSFRGTTETSVRVDYDAANWDVGAAYLRQKNSGGSANTWQVTGGVKFGDWAFGAEYQQWKPSNLASNQRKAKAFTLYAGASFGKFDFQIQAGRLKNKGYAENVKKSTWSVGLNYNLSKRTKFFTEYIRNKVTDTSAETKFFVGMKHSF
ncbi:porin [Leeia sp.]|uniref:porin n=1 Tax=Leeia sp. TaxID=2884678 RepID=UPI0035AFBFA9